MLLAENRPFKIVLVNPDVVFQTAVIEAVEMDGHVLNGDAPQSSNTTGPVASVMLESMYICTPVRLLVKPVATIVMETEVGESCVKATLAVPEGDPTLGAGFSWATVATNCLSQRLDMETATATVAAFSPKFEPSNVMD